MKEKYFSTSLVVLFIFNLLARLWYADSADICLDEPFSIYHAQFQVNVIIDQLKAYNNPPLYEILLHYWIKTFGISPLSVRALPVIFASLGALFLALLGRKLFDTGTGLLAALIYSFSSFTYLYSHDCRAYTLFLMLTVLSILCFLVMVEGSNKINHIYFVLIHALLIYTHYFGFFVFFIEGFYLLRFERKKIRDFILPFLLIGLLYLPQLLVMFQRFLSTTGSENWLKSPNGLEDVYYLIWAFSNVPMNAVLCLLLLISYFYLYFKLTNESRFKKALGLLGIWFFVCLFFMYFVSYKIPMFIPRYLAYLCPAFYLIIAYVALNLFNSPKIRVFLVILLLFGFIATCNFNPDKRFKLIDCMNYISENKTENTLVIVHNPEFLPTFAYHYNQDYFRDVADQKEYSLIQKHLEHENIFHLYSFDEFEALKPRLRNDLILLETQANNILLDSLKCHYKLQFEKEFQGHLRVSGFLTKRND